MKVFVNWTKLLISKMFLDILKIRMNILLNKNNTIFFYHNAYNLFVGFPTTTINEFRNNHYGRGGSTHHLHHLQLMGVN